MGAPGSPTRAVRVADVLERTQWIARKDHALRHSVHYDCFDVMGRAKSGRCPVKSALLRDRGKGSTNTALRRSQTRLHSFALTPSSHWCSCEAISNDDMLSAEPFAARSEQLKSASILFCVSSARNIYSAKDGLVLLEQQDMLVTEPSRLAESHAAPPQVATVEKLGKEVARKAA